MEIFKKTPQIKFLKYKYIALIVTAVIIGAGMVNIFAGRGLKLGVDFGEGTLIRVIFKDTTTVNDVRERLEAVGLGNSQIQETGRVKDREFQIRAVEVQSTTEDIQLESHAALGDKIISAVSGEAGAREGLLDLNTIDQKNLAALLEPAFPEQGAVLSEQIQKARKNETNRGVFVSFDNLGRDGIPAETVTYLEGKTFLGPLNILSRESVGPQVGADLRRKTVLAVVWSLIGMLIYIAFRFKLSYGVAAIFTLAQDVLITVSIYSFSGREFNLPIIAALLTIVGFSINDTIVIFDRIRENQKAFRKLPLEEVMNLSLNQMLGRTFITSGTVLLTVLALFIFGGSVINDFAFTMLIGSIEGIYSTIALSCPIVLFWQKWFPEKRRRR